MRVESCRCEGLITHKIRIDIRYDNLTCTKVLDKGTTYLTVMKPHKDKYGERERQKVTKEKRNDPGLRFLKFVNVE
jgi:hypothetical protein